MQGITLHPLGERSGFEIEQDTINVSIDPGLINYAMKIVERPLDGEARTLLCPKFNLNLSPLTHNDEISAHCSNLDYWLRTTLEPYMSRIKYVIVEKQLRCNDKVLPIMYYTMMWFTVNLRESVTARALLEFPSQIKTTYFKDKK